MIPLRLSTEYIDIMDERTRSLMKESDIQMTLFVSRKSGAGSILLESVLERLRGEGWKNLFLWTDCDCNWEWYVRHGFSLLSKEEYERFSEGDDKYWTYIFKRGI